MPQGENEDVSVPLFQRLQELEIQTTTVEHAPVFTVEEAKAERGELSGLHIKNFFLRNKKKRMWLVVLPEDKKVDLKTLAKRLGAGNLSFGSADRLKEFLGVLPGSVTPFAILNDEGRDQVQVVFDSALRTAEAIHCHPLRNDRTTAISAADLLRFVESTGHTIEWLD